MRCINLRLTYLLNSLCMCTGVSYILEMQIVINVALFIMFFEFWLFVHLRD